MSHRAQTMTATERADAMNATNAEVTGEYDDEEEQGEDDDGGRTRENESIWLSS